MKKTLVFVCLFALLAALLCGCAGKTCERCGESTLSYNLVGDNVDGIHLCNDCVEKMTMGKINFNFTCDACAKEKLGKENIVTVDGEEKVICNTCNTYFEENGTLPN